MPTLDLNHGLNPNAHRGCGNSRTTGGVYLESRVMSEGASISTFKPLTHCFTDPPVAFTAPSTQGMTIIEAPDGTKHLLDHIGATHYPYASDYLEEGRRHGFSRRIPKNLDLSGLTAESRMIAVHPRGRIKNYAEAISTLSNQNALNHLCANYLNTGDTYHLENQVDCNRFHYLMPPSDAPNNMRTLTRDVAYAVANLPESFILEFESAIIAQLPISSIT